MENKEEAMAKVKELVNQSNNIVILLGVGTLIESGGENIWSSRECYRIESIYHKSPDEMMAVGFYSARGSKFYDFYKNEIISEDHEPASLYYDIKRLQDSGKVKKIITQNVDGIHYKAGLTDCIELHGSIHNNVCPHCGKNFDLDYIKSAKAVPLCDVCGTSIKPGIRLFGENIANNLMTDAVNACEQADMIIALGTNMSDNMVRFCSADYKGDKFVLISKEEHYMDKYADIVIHDEVSKVLPLIF